MKKVFDTDDGLQCDSDCQSWFHIKCVGVNKTEYSQYANNLNKKWHCLRVDCHAANSNPSQLLASKMDELLNKFSLLATKDEVKGIADGLQEIKSDINNLSTKISYLEPRIEKLESDVNDLKAKAAAKGEGRDIPVEDIFEEINDRQRRTRNVIVLGLKECESSVLAAVKEHDKNLINIILERCGLGASMDRARFFRLGKATKDKPRAIKLCLSSENEAVTLFKAFGTKIDTGDELDGVSLARDRTLKERQHLSDLRDTLKSRIDSGEPDLTIKYLNGVPKIVKKN